MPTPDSATDTYEECPVCGKCGNWYWLGMCGTHPRKKPPSLGVNPYGEVHRRLYASRGPAKGYVCVDCGGPAQDWTLDHKAKEVKRDDRGRTFSTNLGDYFPRCASDHKRYDQVENTEGLLLGNFKGYKQPQGSSPPPGTKESETGAA